MPKPSQMPPAALTGLCLFLLLSIAMPQSSPLAADLDARGSVFLRFSLSPQGEGFEQPVLGMTVGPNLGGKPGSSRIEARGPRIRLDRAFALEVDSLGKGRLSLIGFNWRWTLSDLIPNDWTPAAREDVGLPSPLSPNN